MKCPKCGYISFDYHLTCPKCQRDITSEQAKLNIPAIAPTPPYLLGVLTGEANALGVTVNINPDEMLEDTGNEIDLNLQGGPQAQEEEFDFEPPEGPEISLDETDQGQGAEAGEEEIEFSGMDETQILEAHGADFALEEADEPDGSIKDKGESPDAPTTAAEDDEPAGTENLLGDLMATEGEEEDVKPGPEDLTLEIGNLDLAGSEGGTEGDADEISGLNLEDLEIEQGEKAPEGAVPTMGVEEAPQKEDSRQAQDTPGEDLDAGEIPINLDDLKVNATGELEFRPAPPKEAAGKGGKPREAPPATSASLEYEELSLEDTEFEDAGPAVEGFAGQEPNPIELNEITLSEELLSDDLDDDGNDIMIDLENLDMDLEMEEGENKAE